MDQVRRSGHHGRLQDLDRFAELGVQALRVPLIWEKIAPRGLEAADWAWADAYMTRLVELGIRPIVGLVHHGSGPLWTGLTQGTFASGLAEFADAVAQRYPEVKDWTPVNEPLTTARFSCLYGHWFPHLQDERSFWLALLNQIDAIRLSMQAIRQVSPGARLVQTEDLGHTYSTARAAGQARFDNARRWMTWDLLFGRVDRHHALWEHIAGFGLADRLEAIANAPCPPDIVGINHYLTSDRFLDEQCDRYPACSHGGNASMSYADVEAVRVVDPLPSGLAQALDEAWRRYGQTLAVTECHIGCTVDEQVRWLNECWATVTKLRASGTDIEGFTIWSLLGSYDWNSLLTVNAGHYEAGAFDVSGGVPAATDLAAAICKLNEGHVPADLDRGWWRQAARLCYPPHPPYVEESPGSSPRSSVAGLGEIHDRMQRVHGAR